MHQGYFVEVGDTFSDFVLGYQLMGLHAENYKPDLNTDAAAMLIQSRQKPNGEWPYRASRYPPADLPGLHWADRRCHACPSALRTEVGQGRL